MGNMNLTHNRKQGCSSGLQEPREPLNNALVKRAGCAEHADADDKVKAMIDKLDVVNVAAYKPNGWIDTAYRIFGLLKHPQRIIHANDESGINVGVQVPAGSATKLKDLDRRRYFGSDLLNALPVDTRSQPINRFDFAFFIAARVLGRIVSRKRSLHGGRKVHRGPHHSQLLVACQTLLVILLAAASANAATSYYAGQGPGDSDLNSCATATSDANGSRKRNIMGATGGISCLAAGDTLDIRAGIYNETIRTSLAPGLPNGTSSAPVTIRGHAGETVEIRMIDIGFNAGRQYIVFDNFVIDNDCAVLPGLVTTCGWSGVHVGGGNDHITVQNGIIRDSDSIGVEGNCAFCSFINLEIYNSRYYGVYWRGNNSLFERLTIHDNFGYGVHNYDSDQSGVSNNIYRYNRIYANGGYAQTQYGIIVANGTGNQVYGNLIYGNTRGVQIGSTCINCLVYNNTIYKNDKANGPSCGGCQPQNSAGIDNGSTTTIIKNNILDDNPVNGINSSGGATILNNHCDSAATGCNTTGNPLFVNTSTFDFHLQSGSPAIGGAECLASPYNIDFDLVNRPQGATCDSGAFEFASAGAPTFDLTVNSTRPATVAITGTVSGTASFTSNQSSGAILAEVAPATATGGNTFVQWSGCDSVSGTGNRTCNLTMTSDRTIIAHYQFPVSASEVAWWKFNDASGTNANDESANNNDGTLVNGPTWVTGKIEGAINFDATNDHVTVADAPSLDLSWQYSISNWTSPAAAYTTFKSILSKGDKYFFYASSSNYCGPGAVLAGHQTGGSYQLVCYATPLPILSYTHNVVTFDGTLLRLYRDTVLVASASALGPVDVGTDALLMGASTFGENWGGGLDSVRLFNKTLSQAEITTIFNEGNPAGAPVSIKLGTVGGNPATWKCGSGCVIKAGSLAAVP